MQRRDGHTAASPAADRAVIFGALGLGAFFVYYLSANRPAPAGTSKSGGGGTKRSGGTSGFVLPVGGGAFGGVEWENPSPREFVGNVRKFIEDDPEMGAFLTEHSPGELEGYTLIGTENGVVGVAVSPEGDIQNLYNHSGPSGAGEEALEQAVEAGGRTLDCYDGFLRDFYAAHGFRETGRIKFDPQYAPEGWSEEMFGQPDIVFMAYRPEQLTAPESDNYYDPHEWEQAKQDSRRAASD